MLFEFAMPDFNQKGELYHFIYNKIKEAILCGALKEGEKLPSIRDGAGQLRVSRTTIENAYTRLCIEGLVESFPQRGYFVAKVIPKQEAPRLEVKGEKIPVKYDFSSRSIDNSAADTELWKKMLRSVLWNSGELNSYGDPQGEESLRAALSSYAYTSRGVVTKKENIIVGAGIGPLLNIICSLLGRQVTVGIENGGFKTAEVIFGDFGIRVVPLDSDKNGATLESIRKNDIDILFLMPSSLSKISVTSLSKRRNEYAKWAKEENKLIIEDDFNGELRYTARTVSAFQNKLRDNCIYIGSFSKLLLPSVRIAYMSLTDSLIEKFKEKKPYLNQTCGKLEQLTLEKYITTGALEKHLRKLRRLYYNKSKIMTECIKANFPQLGEITLFETSLMLEFDTGVKKPSLELCHIAKANGISLIPSNKEGEVILSFSGISERDIPDAIKTLHFVLTKK